MSQNTHIFSGKKTAAPKVPLPSFLSKETVEAYFKSHPEVWNYYLQLPSSMQEELICFCMGKQGLKITYDSVFKQIFNTNNETGFQRIERLLSAILCRSVKIIRFMPREGTQMSESASFVVMDILVQLEDKSFANIEMQKIGYNFPLSRADCYVSDIIMRQYVTAKSELGSEFSFNDMHKVYCIILMEYSPKEFHSVPGKYMHRRISSFDTGIYKNFSGLHEDIFICLDSFRSIVHTITKESNELEAWLTFLSATDVNIISALIEAFPSFTSIYQEIADFVKNPEELIQMLSKELYIMDKNMERLMVAQLHEEVNAEKKRADDITIERDNAVAERNNAIVECQILRLSRKNRSPEEIADALKLSLEYINSILDR